MMRDCVGAYAVEQDAGGFGGIHHLGHDVAVELHGGQQTLAADFVDETVPGLQTIQPVVQHNLHALDVAQDVIFQQVPRAGGGGGSGQALPPKVLP